MSQSTKGQTIDNLGKTIEEITQYQPEEASS
jgi:hypothetical protein